MALNNRCAAPARPQSTTIAPGALEGTQVGSLSDTAVRAAFNNASLLPRQQIIDLLDQAATLLPSGYYPQITPQGGRASRENTENHPSGWAADVQIVNQGTVLTPYDAPNLYADFISGLVGNTLINNRVYGLGLYDWGIHIDQSEWRQTGGPGGSTWNGWPRGQSAGPQEVLDAGVSAGEARANRNQFVGLGSTPEDGSSGSIVPVDGFSALADPDGAALADIEAQRQLQTACDSNPPFSRPPGGGGCGALGGFGFAAAASLAGGFGLGIPSSLTSATNLFNGALPVSLNGSIVDIVGNAQNFLNVSGITNISAFTNDMLNVGVGNTLNALTGKMTASVAGIINGGVNNLISGPINEIASNVFGNGDLSKFTNIFNNVVGATGAAGGIAQGLEQLGGQVFGNARETIGALGTNPFETVAGLTIDNLAGGLIQDLVGPIGETLEQVTKGGPMAMFGTAYRDMNAMITQGFGSLTTDLPALGRDLSSLGRLANMEDLLRIGTPGQIVEQLSLNGADAVPRIIADRLISKGLSIAEINRPENDNTAKEILAEIDDPELIADAFRSLNIQRTPDVPNLSVLEDPDWLFPNSKEKNRFNKLNEASLHLSILDCGKLKDTQELGNLLSEMESISAESELLNEIQPVKIEENLYLKDLYVPTSEYSGDGDLTVADFIGTAAGYRVTETLPKMRQYMDELVEAGVLDCYTSLLELLRDTLLGNYDYDGISPPVPAIAGTYLTENDFVTPLIFCGRYTFGYYATMELAAYAVKAAIEDELDYIYDNATGETLEKLKRLQALHDETNHQLYKEQKLRKKYGIDIGFSKTGVEVRTGDGSTNDFVLTGTPDTENDPNLTVFVAGLKLTGGQFSYNATTKTVTTSTAPGSGETVEIIYDTGNFDVTGNLRDIWNFSSNLENFGVSTGFGREADYLQRVITDDVHGTRIKSAMMQARNRERASAYGLECPGYNRVLSDFNNEHPNGVSTFTEVTGIWSDDVGRASEIYLQHHTNFDSREEYVAYQIKKNKNRQQQNFDDIMSTVSRKLIFYSGGYIAISHNLAKFYSNFKDQFRSKSFNSNDILKVRLTDDFPTDGFVIGPYKQIISEILRQESVKDLIFDVEMSDQAKAYLKTIDIDLRILVPMIQKVLLVNASNYLGLNESDTKNIFGVPGVGKYLVSSIANQL